MAAAATPRKNTKKNTYFKEFIKVYIRQRPFSLEEQQKPQLLPAKYEQRLTPEEVTISSNGKEKTYNFDQVFDEKASQAAIFQSVVAPLIGEVINGQNCTIIAYGPTGSGKTHTMFGLDFNKSLATLLRHNACSAWGLVPRAAQELFVYLSQPSLRFKDASVRVSFIEIFNEEVCDLLAENNKAKNPPLLRLLEETNKSTTPKRSLTEAAVSDTRSALALIRSAAKHQRPFQSHAIVTFTVTTRNSSSSTEARLQFVDLAGARISRSMFTLERVLAALSRRRRRRHVPFRDSKLTRALQPSLEGRALVRMVATLAPPRPGAFRCAQHALETAQCARAAAAAPAQALPGPLGGRLERVVWDLERSLTFFKLYRQGLIANCDRVSASTTRTKANLRKLDIELEQIEKSALWIWRLRQEAVQRGADDGGFIDVQFAAAMRLIQALLKDELQESFHWNWIGKSGQYCNHRNSFRDILEDGTRTLKLIRMNFYLMKLSGCGNLGHPLDLPKIHFINTLLEMMGMCQQVELQMKGDCFKLELNGLMEEVEKVVCVK